MQRKTFKVSTVVYWCLGGILICGLLAGLILSTYLMGTGGW